MTVVMLHTKGRERNLAKSETEKRKHEVLLPFAGLDLRNHEGETALDCAARGQQQRTITFLLLHGARVNPWYVASYAMFHIRHAADASMCV